MALLGAVAAVEQQTDLLDQIDQSQLTNQFLVENVNNDNVPAYWELEPPTSGDYPDLKYSMEDIEDSIENVECNFCQLSILNFQ